MKEHIRLASPAEIRKAFPLSGVIFDGKVVRPLPVASEVRRAGTLVSSVRDTSNIPEYIFAGHAQIHVPELRDLEKGTGYVELDAVQLGLGQYLYEKDDKMVEIERLRNNQQWFRTVTRPEMTLGDTIERMCAADFSYPYVFARKAGVANLGGMNFYIKDTRTPHPYILNSLIKASAIDPDSKAAKYIRLQRERKKPPTLEEFRTQTIDKTLQQLRFVNGLSGTDLEKELHYSHTAISSFERGKRTVNERVLETYAKWLKLPSDSPLLWSLYYRLHNPQIPLPDWAVEAVFDEERLLFQEHIDQIRLAPVRYEDTLLLGNLRRYNSTSEKITYIKNKYQFGTAANVEINGETSILNFKSISAENTIPEAVSIAKLMTLTGRDIHNPVTDHLLRSAKMQRIARYSWHKLRNEVEAA